MKKNELFSGRLLLRPVELDDTDAIHGYAGDQSIAMMLNLPNETREETVAFVRSAVAEWEKEEPEDREYVIVYEGKVVGGINLAYSESREVVEIGWIVHRDYRNKGIASEAAKRLIDYAFHVLSARKVIAHCDSRNAASEKVMKNAGMHLADQRGTRFYPKTGVVSGELLYAITDDEKR